MSRCIVTPRRDTSRLQESIAGVVRAGPTTCGAAATMVAMAGYSGTPLARKLGITVGARVLLDGAPGGFDLGELPGGVTVHQRPAAGAYDVILFFCPSTARLLERWRGLPGRPAPARAHAARPGHGARPAVDRRAQTLLRRRERPRRERGARLRPGARPG